MANRFRAAYMRRKRPAPRPVTPMRFLRARVAATSYEFIVPEVLGGWAICTVNDATGELLITSDWGNWSYQWSTNPSALGHPTLTDFLGLRSDVDYLARKLSGRDSEEFDVAATVDRMIGVIAAQRLNDGRTSIDYTRDDEGMTFDQADEYLDRIMNARRDNREFWTKDAARSLADDIIAIGEELGDHCTSAEALFCDRVAKVIGDHCGWDLMVEPWELIEKRQTYRDRMLREAVLPALIAACHMTSVQRSLVAANGPQDRPEYPQAAEVAA